MNSVMKGNDETDINVAIRNARANQEKLVIKLPKSLELQERRLLKKVRKQRGGALRKLKYLYKEIDATYAYVDGFTACRRFCSHCCHYPISISEVEIRYIERHTDHRRSSVETDTSDVATRSTPCPFLKGDECSIYEHRPFVCRTHVALTRTAYWCETSRCNEHEFPRVKFSEIDKSFELIRHESDSLNVQDIRQVFYTFGC